MDIVRRYSDPARSG